MLTVLVLAILFGGASVGHRLQSFFRTARRKRHAARQHGDTSWSMRD
jgi:hypothetical protein